MRARLCDYSVSFILKSFTKPKLATTDRRARFISRVSCVLSIGLFLLLPNTVPSKTTEEARISTLLRQVKSPNVAVRRRAIDALGGNQFALLGRGVPTVAIPALIESLNDQDVLVRMGAATALGNCSEDSLAVPALLKALKDQDAAVRGSAAMALRKIKKHAEVVIPALVEALMDEDPLVRWSASNALEQINPEADKASLAVNPLIELLKGQNDDVRRNAAEALRRLRGQAKSAIPFLISVAKDQSASDITRSTTVYALAEIDLKGEVIIPTLVELLQDKHTCASAAKALGDVGVERESQSVMVLETPNNRSVYVSGEGDKRIKSDAKPAIPILIELLRDQDEYIRASAAEALSRIGAEPKVIVPLLIELLGDSSENVRYSAVNAIGEVGPEAAVAAPALVELIKRHDEVVRRGGIANTLKEIKADGQLVVPALISLLKDSNQETYYRSSIIETLAEVGPEAKQAIPILIESLNDKENVIREGSATALAEISFEVSKAKDASAINLLKDAYGALRSSTDPEVNKHADAVKRSIDFLELLWWEQLRQWIQNHPYTLLALAVYPLLLMIWLVCLWLRPLWLLRINETLKFDTKLNVAGKLVEVSFPIRYLLIAGFFHYHRRVLDAWTARYISSAKKTFGEIPTVKEREAHIPISVVLDRANIANLTPEDLKPAFSKNVTCTLIWGEGGAGKTSLACQLAKWSMSDEKKERLSQKHLMLPVLIEQDLEFQTKDSESIFLKIIKDRLRTLIDEVDPPSPNLLHHLLKKRRVLVIVDGMSEMNEVSRRSIIAGITDIPVNALIVTSRTDESLNNLPKSVVKPMRIRGNKLSTFMEAYLSFREKRDLFEDEEFFDACRRLSIIVGDRDITVLLAKYYAEQLIAAKEGTIDYILPENIPDLMLQYISGISSKSLSDVHDLRSVLNASKVIAWECLKNTFRPMPARSEDVVAGLGGEERGSLLLKYFEETLRIIQTVGVEHDRIRFTVDPVSEYLAGLHLVSEYKEREELWQQFLIKADEQDGAPDSIREFLLAVRDCCLAKAGEVKIPNFVPDELAKRIGISPEDRLKARTEGRVRRLIQNLKLPYAEDRAEAAIALAEIGKQSKRAVPDLIELLKDRDHIVRLRAIYALQRIGPDAKEATPSLIELLNNEDSTTQGAVAHALGEIGPEAKEAIPHLLRLLKVNFTDFQQSVTIALAKMGQPAVPALLELLNNEEDRIRWCIADALGMIRPKATEAIPALINLLRDPNEGTYRIAAISLGNMGASAVEAIPDLIKLLKHQDVELNKAAFDAIEKIGPVAIPALSLLIQNKQDEISNRVRDLIDKINLFHNASSSGERLENSR